MKAVRKLGAVLAILACVSIGAGQAFAGHHFKTLFLIYLWDIDPWGGFYDTGWPVLGKAVINTKNGQIHAQAKGWVWNDSWRNIEYRGLSGLYFWADIPEEILATFICKYKVHWDGQAHWSGKGYVPFEEEVPARKKK